MCAEIYNRKSVNRTGRPLSRSYPPVRLDLTDVTNLQDLLRRLCGRAILYTGNQALRDCNQLKKSGKEILHDLRLEGDNPQISIVLRHDYVRVYIEEDFVFAEQAFLEIERILKRCYRRIAGIFTNYYVIIFGSLALIGAGIATWYSTGGLLRPLLLSIITLMYAALSIFNYKVEKVYSTILLTKDKHHIR
jgi:hypothetical protein